ncbi:hypothetical protein ROSEINA2194_03434 [Roseburia inulinivorans DSM 16841]|uniref:Uncharacterized protein n=1 Tax=Roseburia inulinivorans DSM 16841 TaxID=622312 RepID=C0FXF4_9FIRM|nr:hypothetical protein ROSEINA2194_03434 [Roseburia inulinivorans DSM 16841]
MSIGTICRVSGYFFDREGFMAKGKTSIFSASPADTNRPNGWGSVRDVRNGIHL